jgi:CIC family chloride channel protein
VANARAWPVSRLAGWAESIRLREHENKVLLVLTLIIGAVVGLVVVAFILLTENLGGRLYPAGGAAWRRLLIPVVGSLATGFLLFRYFPNARGSGIPQTKIALFLRDGYISFRTVAGKFGLCSVSLASGIALGREGPAVQVGAGLASVLGRKLGLNAASVKALVPSGAAAALAAAFNTPISAVLFSLEEVMGDMQAPVLGSIVLASATSWMMLHLVLGDEPLFHVPAYQLVHPVEFLWYAVLGLVGGLVSVCFVKLLLWQRRHFQAMPKSTQWLLPAIGGLTVGILGWFFPNVLGVGYAVVGQALNGQMVLGTMALLVLLKIVATATCYASGNAGGIFGPSLFIGAMTGGAVGAVGHWLMPDYTGSVGAYALVGMGATFAGVVRVPLTSVIMIFEITRDYSIIVPLMIANLISYFISSRLQEEPIYEALMHQDGVSLPSHSRARDLLLTVGHAFRPESQALPADERAGQAAAAVDRAAGAWPVVDRNGLRGMLTVEQLDRAVQTGLADEPVGQLVPDPGDAERLAQENFPHVHTDQSLDAAMRRIATSGLKVLPVVSRDNVRALRGTVSVTDILAAYAIGPVRPEPGPGGGAIERPARLLAGLLAAMMALVMLIGFLNYYYRAERSGRALGAYRAGNELMRKERYEEAIEQYRKALSVSHNSENRLALGLALIKAGSLNEAGIYLQEVLAGMPRSGPAHRGLAQIYAQQGRTADAALHYRQAIDGVWPDRAEENRAQTRMELGRLQR